MGATNRAWLDAAVQQQTDECIVWPFGVGSHGYGALSVNGVMQTTHTYACEVAHGPRPEGMQVCHSCHERRCVNPRHLRWCTSAENTDDARAAGRLRGPEQRETCKHGHPLKGTNVSIKKNGERRCLTCHRERQRRYVAKRKGGQ